MAGNSSSGRHSYDDVRECYELRESGYYDECRCARFHSWDLFIKMGLAPDPDDDYTYY